MKKRIITAALLSSALTLAAGGSAFAQAFTICNPGTGTSGTNSRGQFYTWFENMNVEDCNTRMRVLDNTRRTYRAFWDQEKNFQADAVGGMGWEFGSSDRVIRYTITNFQSNANTNVVGVKAVAGIYGWTCVSRDRVANPNTSAQEYYIIDDWVGDNEFVPFDDQTEAPAIAKSQEVSANGGTYKVYVIERNEAPQYCGDGSPRKFTQFWSVRTQKTSRNTENTIEFARHSNVWDDFGFRATKVSNGYQVVAVEAFGAGPTEDRHVGEAAITAR